MVIICHRRQEGWDLSDMRRALCSESSRRSLHTKHCANTTSGHQSNSRRHCAAYFRRLRSTLPYTAAYFWVFALKKLWEITFWGWFQLRLKLWEQDFVNSPELYDLSLLGTLKISVNLEQAYLRKKSVGLTCVTWLGTFVSAYSYFRVVGWRKTNMFISNNSTVDY